MRKEASQLVRGLRLEQPSAELTGQTDHLPLIHLNLDRRQALFQIHLQLVTAFTTTIVSLKPVREVLDKNLLSLVKRKLPLTLSSAMQDCQMEMTTNLGLELAIKVTE